MISKLDANDLLDVYGDLLTKRQREILSLYYEEDFSYTCLLYTSPSPRDRTRSRMPSSA